jgi:DNA-binding NtrC family response regulator
MARILVVDDEPKMRTILSFMLSSRRHEVEEAQNGIEALNKLEASSFDLVVSDIRMDGMDGTRLLSTIREREMGCPVVFITAYATLESAVEALRLGAADYLVKPFEEQQVLLAVERALGFGRIMEENVRLKQDLRQDENGEKAVLASEPMVRVEEMALKVAASEATVLVTGESGTGKEVIAQLIHRASPRRERRFVAVNCGAISSNLVESELFGHEKGAFTGADRRKEGKFEFANEGTLFLDEVAELPLESQVKLLRAIQDKCVTPVGGNRNIPVDVRLICATNQDLERFCEQGRFRNDLYYRIAVFPIKVPPLRERKKDIVPLAHHFISKLVGPTQGGKDPLTPSAIKVLTEYTWPGNVRELANAVERAVILKSGNLPITSDDLDFLRTGERGPDQADACFKLPATGVGFEELQRSVIRQALEMTLGNQSAAARLLRLTRARFRTFLKMLDGEDR